MNRFTPPAAKTALPIAVILQRTRLHNPWQRWSWSAYDVLPDDGWSRAPHCLVWNPAASQWLFAGHVAELHPDEAEGYHLNLTSPTPSWFVWWTAPGDLQCEDPRMHAEGLPCVQAVTLSYNEAARWLDAGATVEVVSLAGPVANWLADFTSRHYRPEPRRRARPQSFLSPEDRDTAPAVSGAPASQASEPPAAGTGSRGQRRRPQ